MLEQRKVRNITDGQEVCRVIPQQEYGPFDIAKTLTLKEKLTGLFCLVIVALWMVVGAIWA